MGCRDSDRLVALRVRMLVAALALLCIGLPAVGAAATGKIGGRIVATDNGEPIGFADLLLIPADTTMRRIGGLSNADGTYLLEARAGRYALQIRALSYATKRLPGITIEEGKLLPFSTALSPEALVQEEIVVEARRAQDTEASLLSARKKAPTVGDAISAEQVRKSADSDAAEVLRRVTGLTVSDGKYVFVRGLGERYSSTEVDGVRLASPEQNKRVVPLDLLPANLVDNITVQKTYTADRPGEFGGGDVQVRTKDFPGQRTWSLSLSQGLQEGVTFHDRETYGSNAGDVFASGARDRGMPAAVDGVPIPSFTPTNYRVLRGLAKEFTGDWKPASENTIPSGGYSLTYGDQVKVFSRPLGLIQSWSYSRGYNTLDEVERYYKSDTELQHDYAVRRWTESVQFGGLSAFAYRLSPRHSVHVRGLMTQSADDEVRYYEGPDANQFDFLGNPIVNRNTRYKYTERQVLTGSTEGRHTVSALQLDWRFGRSRAQRQTPDMREFNYGRNYYPDGDGNPVEYWSLKGWPTREYGKMTENGWGTTITASLPYRFHLLGSGKIVAGFDRQTKERAHVYRRLSFELPVTTPGRGTISSLPIDGYLADTNVVLRDNTLADRNGPVDNYRAGTRIEAGFLNLDVPFGPRVRGSFGLRVESGWQTIESHALYRPDSLLVPPGVLDNVDLLPSGNLTWSVNDAINLRLAGSQTLSRPDLDELSTSPFFEFIGGYERRGNPKLQRALLDNYDVRLEVFPGISEVVAVGVFYKRLRSPIEQVIKSAVPTPLLQPENAAGGRNRGLEIELRTGLGRLWKPLGRFSINSNAAFIDSRVELAPRLSQNASQAHPLQGQADYVVNVALNWAVRDGLETTVLLNATGERLQALGLEKNPDIYLEPITTLDATMNARLFQNMRVKLTARNLLDPEIKQVQGPNLSNLYKTGRSFSLSFSLGS